MQNHWEYLRKNRWIKMYLKLWGTSKKAPVLEAVKRNPVVGVEEVVVAASWPNKPPGGDFWAKRPVCEAPTAEAARADACIVVCPGKKIFRKIQK